MSYSVVAPSLSQGCVPLGVNVSGVYLGDSGGGRRGRYRSGYVLFINVWCVAEGAAAPLWVVAPSTLRLLPVTSCFHGNGGLDVLTPDNTRLYIQTIERMLLLLSDGFSFLFFLFCLISCFWPKGSVVRITYSSAAL